MKNQRQRQEWFEATIASYGFSPQDLSRIKNITGLIFGVEFQDDQERCMLVAFFLSELGLTTNNDLGLDVVIEMVRQKLVENNIL